MKAETSESLRRLDDAMEVMRQLREFVSEEPRVIRTPTDETRDLVAYEFSVQRTLSAALSSVATGICEQAEGAAHLLGELQRLVRTS